MNNIKLIPYKIYTEKYQASTSIDEELRDWKNVNTPHLPGLIFKDSSDARFLVTLPPNPVLMFDSSKDFKNFALKKSERESARKSTYEGMIPTKQVFLASMDRNRNVLAKQLNLPQAQLNYNLESIIPMLDALKSLPKVGVVA
jgi:hypothetical protein